MKKTKKVLIHCSGSDELAQDSIIDHGYHYFINQLGRLVVVKPIGSAKTIKVCLSGKSCFQKSQFRVLEHLIYELREKFDDIDIGPCRPYDKKTGNPGFNVEVFLSKIAPYTGPVVEEEPES